MYSDMFLDHGTYEIHAAGMDHPGRNDPAASQVLLPPTVRSVTSGGAGGTSSWDGTLGRNWQGSLLPKWDPRFTIGKWWFNQ